MQQKHLITFRHGSICFGLTITCPVSECYYLPSYWQMLRKQELCFLIIGKGRSFFFTPKSSSCTHCHSKYKQYSTTYTITTPGEDQGCLIFFTYVWEGKLYSTNSLERFSSTKEIGMHGLAFFFSAKAQFLYRSQMKWCAKFLHKGKSWVRGSTDKT